MPLNDSEYNVAFEKLQRMKAELYDQNKKHLYSEDNDTYTANNFKLAKRKYIERSKRIHALKRLIHYQNKLIVSMKGLYVMSRSDKFEKELKEAFDTRTDLLNELAMLTGMDELVVFIRNSKSESKEDFVNIEGDQTVEQKDSSTSSSLSSIKKKKKTMKFLFDTYQQCISQKTSEPTYMSKDMIVKHIKQHDPWLLKYLPKKISAMKKEDWCKVIFV